MGLFDFFKPKQKDDGRTLNYAPTMSGKKPFYSSFGDSLYASDIVVQSIRCKANEFKKLDPRHIRTVGGVESVVTDSSIAKVLQRPNDFMTMADLLEKAVILLELNKNSYLYPTYYWTKAGEKYYTGLFPLKPRRVEYQANEAGKLFICFTFGNGYEITLPAEDVIHWRKDYGLNDYFGGSAFGGNDTAGLMRAVSEYDRLCQSISKAVEASCQVNGIVKFNSYLATEKQIEEQQEFNERLQNNESGFLFTDLKAEVQKVPRDVKLVDAETLKFFYDTITRANGVSLPILNGDYNKAQKEAFYEHALEADIIALGQAFSKCVFSNREAAFGNKIHFYPNDIAFMSMENKISALQAGLPAGIFTKNEARALLGYPPIDGGDAMPRGYNELDGQTNGGVTDDEE